MKNLLVALPRCLPSSAGPLVFHRLFILQLLHCPDLRLYRYQLLSPRVCCQCFTALLLNVTLLYTLQTQSQHLSLIPDPLPEGVLSSCQQVHQRRFVIVRGVIRWSGSWYLLTGRCCSRSWGIYYRGILPGELIAGLEGREPVLSSGSFSFIVLSSDHIFQILVVSYKRFEVTIQGSMQGHCSLQLLSEALVQLILNSLIVPVQVPQNTPK